MKTLNPNSNSNESEFVDRLKSADGRAWAAFFRMYREHIFHFLNYYVQETEVKKELLQLTYMKLWCYIGSYDPEKLSLEAWVNKTARNRAFDYLRKVQRAENEQASFIEEQHSPTAEETVDPMAGFDIREMVKRLKPKYAEVVELVYFKRCTHQQVADKLNVRLSTVKSRIQVAIRQLKKMFGWEGKV